ESSRRRTTAAEATRGSASTAPSEKPASPPVPTPGLGALRGRRGGRMPLEGPPPILPGQAIPSPRTAAAAESAPTEATAAPATSEETSSRVAAGDDLQTAGAPDAQSGESTEGTSRSRRGRRGGRGRGRSAAGTGV